MAGAPDSRAYNMQDAVEIKYINITDRGVRAVKMTDMAAGGEPRAELLRLLAGMMDDTLQLLYVVPSEHEAIALQSFFDEAFIEKYTLCFIKEALQVSKMMLTTYTVLRQLLKQEETLPDQLVLVLDPSFMPPTVDMEIATGMAQDWIRGLKAKDSEGNMSVDPTTNIKVTMFCMTSAFRKCTYMTPWIMDDSWQTYEVRQFGLRKNKLSLECTSAGAHDYHNFRSALRNFMGDVAASIAANQTGEQQDNDTAPGPCATLLCIMPEAVFNLALQSLESEERLIMDKMHQYIIDYTKQPGYWQITTDKICFQDPRFVANVLILDPHIGIMHRLPSITHVIIGHEYEMHRYSEALRRMLYPSLVRRTAWQLKQHVQLLVGSHITALRQVSTETTKEELDPRSGSKLAIWSPSVTKDLTLLFLEAHLTWPQKLLQDMPIGNLPSEEALNESMGRLKRFGCVTKDKVLNPDIEPALAELVRLVPDFNLVMLLSGIKILKAPEKLAKVIIHIALLMYHGLDNFLVHVKDEDQMEVDDAEPEIGKSAEEVLETLDLMNSSLLGSTDCGRKGMLFRAWACLSSALTWSRYKKHTYTDEVIWERVIDGFEINLNLVHRIANEAQVIANLLGVQHASKAVGKLSDEEILEIETHLTHAFIFELALFPSNEGDDPLQYTAIDLRSSAQLCYAARRFDSFFTPSEQGPLQISRCAIVFDVTSGSAVPRPEILSEQFIPAPALFGALCHFKGISPTNIKDTLDEFFKELMENKN